MSFNSASRLSRALWSRAIVCLCLSVSDFDRYSLTIARWLATPTTLRSPAEIYTAPRDVTPLPRAPSTLSDFQWVSPPVPTPPQLSEHRVHQMIVLHPVWQMRRCPCYIRVLLRPGSPALPS